MKVMHVLRVKTNFFWDSLNVIRASILGANDGIISVSGIVLGAAGANLDSKTLLISGLSGMLAGACSMAGGEWISVSTQRDIQEKTMERQLENEDCENCPIKLQKNDILMPFHAAASSFCSFIIGAMIPLLTMILARLSLIPPFFFPDLIIKVSDAPKPIPILKFINWFCCNIF